MKMKKYLLPNFFCIFCPPPHTPNTLLGLLADFLKFHKYFTMVAQDLRILMGEVLKILITSALKEKDEVMKLIK